MLENLVMMSNKYGADPAFVMAGGGNTSYKDENTLYVKGSGTQLAVITEEGFVAMDRRKIDEVFVKTYSSDDASREAEVLADMLAARLPGNESKRPSVEAALHNILKYKYVLHLHPSSVNGITCGREGKEAADKMFGDSYIWIPICKPGYILSQLCKKKLDEFAEARGYECNLIILQNHGIFFAADSTEEMDRFVESVMSKIYAACSNVYDFTPVEYDSAEADRIRKIILEITGKSEDEISFIMNKSVSGIIGSDEKYSLIAKPFSPDHIVYCKAEYVYTDADSIREAYEEFNKTHDYQPKVFVIKGFGVFVTGNSKKDLGNVIDLFLDAVKVGIYTTNFGGPLPMTDDLIDFIVHWEIESYRSKLAQ